MTQFTLSCMIWLALIAQSFAIVALHNSNNNLKPIAYICERTIIAMNAKHQLQRAHCNIFQLAVLAVLDTFESIEMRTENWLFCKRKKMNTAGLPIGICEAFNIFLQFSWGISKRSCTAEIYIHLDPVRLVRNAAQGTKKSGWKTWRKCSIYLSIIIHSFMWLNWQHS